MRAVRFVEAARLELVDLPDPVPAGGEVLVDVAACGICGSDLSCWKTGVFAGAVLGHEISATTTDGSPVVVDPKTPCGACDDCAGGAEHRCAFALTHAIGQQVQGGFAERMAVPSRLLIPVPDGVDLETASLTEPLAVVMHGFTLAGVHAEPAVVIGLGPIGLLAVAALADLGAHPIVGVDPVPSRRALAERLGATATGAPGDGMLHEAKPSLVVEASGHPTALADAGNVAAPGARVLMLGIPMGEAAVWPMVWVTKELRIIGSISHQRDDFHAALGLLARAPRIGDVITARVPLEDVPAAFEQLTTSPNGGKVIVTP